MNNKTRIIIEIIIVIALFVWYIITILIPELKQEYGSSDTFINSNSYNNMIELKIDNKIDFAMVFNQDNKLYHMFFFNKDSRILYNENIENNQIDIGIEKTIKLLIEKDELKTGSNIIITSYNSNQEKKDILFQIFKKYHLELNIIEEEKELKDKLEELSLYGENEEKMLLELDYYSKSITGIGHKKNKK